MSRHSKRLSLPLLTLSSLLLVHTAAAETTCIVAADGKSWQCGTAEELADVQPGRAVRPESPRNLPPPLLIDPARLPRIEYEAAAAGGFAKPTEPPVSPPPAVPDTRPASESWLQQPTVGSRPAQVASAAPSQPVEETRPEAAQAATVAPLPATTAAAVAPLDAAVEAGPATTAEPPRSANPPPAATPTAAAPAATPTTATPAPAPPPPPTPASQPSPQPQAAADSRPLPAASTPAATPNPAPQVTPAARFDLRPRALSDWQDREYTVQLLATRQASEIAGFAASSGIPAERLFVVRLRQPDADWWLLCTGRHADLEQARSALEALPTLARQNGAWPRRIGPLKKDALP